MENVTDFNAAKARERTDKARGADLSFVRCLSACLAEIQCSADLGAHRAWVNLDQEVRDKVYNELERRGFALQKVRVFTLERVNSDSAATKSTHLVTW